MVRSTSGDVGVDSNGVITNFSNQTMQIMQKTAIGSLFYVGFPVVSSDRTVVGSFRLPAQMLRIMRLLTFFLFAASFTVSARPAAQTVTISGKGLTLKQVFTAIEKQTGYVLFNQKGALSEAKTVSLSVYNMPLGDLLALVLKDRPYEYTVKRKTIFISHNSSVVSSEQPDMFYAPLPLRIHVTDTDGNTLSGASIINKNTRYSGSTDLEGVLSLNVNVGDVIEISYIGFEKQFYTIKNNTTAVTIVLKRTDNPLDDVEVNAGYYKTSKRHVTGSIAKVDAKIIEDQPVGNVLAALQGRMPGVEVSQSSAYAGGGFKLRIRGQNSINSGNEPLYIIDGAPYDSKSMSESSVSQIFNGDLNPLAILNPSDIESIEVLKDADATAIYGSRGANGVMLITTKKGKNQKTSLNISFDKGMGKITKFQQLLTTEQFLQISRKGFTNDGRDYKTSGNPAIDGTWPEDRYTDWQKVLMGKTSHTNEAQVSLSGGDGYTQYYISSSFRTETAVILGDHKYHRGTVLGKTSHSSKDNRLKLMFSTNYSVDAGSLPVYDAGFAASTLAPNAPELYKEDGTINFQPGFNNPAIELTNYYKHNRYALISNVDITYKIIPGLEFKNNMGYTSTTLEDYAAYPATLTNEAPYNDSKRSNVTRNNATRRSWTIEPQLSWRKVIGKGTISVLAGLSWQSQSDIKFLASGMEFSSDAVLSSLSAAKMKYITRDDTEQYRYNAAFGRVNYIWDGKYLLNLTGRRDGSSRFGPNNKFANFGAIGAGWVFSKETFMQNILGSVISYGKLRGSIGTAGNDQIGDYQFLDTYTMNANQIYAGSTVMDPSRLYNANFAWEVNRKAELAIDLSFLNDRILLSVMHYRNISSNQLVGIPLPATTGFRTLTANLNAEVANTGVEFELSTVNIKRKNFHWTTSFNLTIPRNKLVAFPDLESSTYASMYEVGRSLNIKKLYHNLGVDPQTGVYVFEDYNHDDKISGLADRRFIKDFSSNFFGGMSNSFTYKNWSLDAFLHFSSNIGYNYLAQIYAGFGNQSVLTLANRWQQPGDNAFLQRYTAGYNAEASLAADRFFLSNDAYSKIGYLRLKNIAVAYSIPPSVLKNIRCRLYIQGQNLLTFTKFKGPDPEAPTQASNIVKTVNFGAKISF